MSKNVIGARMIHRLSYVNGITPTIPYNDDHTLGWSATDIYKGELFINMNDDRAFTRTNTNSGITSILPNGIIEFLISDKSTGKIPVNKMANQINGNFYISSGLTVGTLTGPFGSGLRPVFADEYGTLSVYSAIPGTGTVTQITLGLGLTGSTSTITTTGNIELGVPSSIHSGSTNSVSNGTHSHRFIPAGNTNEIQLNISGVLSSSSKFKYDGTNLYVSGITQSATTYGIFYDNLTGKLTYNDITIGGTVTNISAGSGMSFSDITSTGNITLGTPSDITSNSGNWLYLNSHTHRLNVDGITGSIQYKTNTDSGITGNSNFTFDGTDLYVSGMSYYQTPYILYFDPNNGKITYSDIQGGTVTSISAGSGMSFSDITTSGYIELGTPNSITPYSTNETTIHSHTHQFIPAGSLNCIQLNGDSVLSASLNFKYDGTDLYISGMTQSTTNNVVYFDESNGKLTYGLKPSGGGELITTGSTSFNSGTTIIIDTYPTINYNFSTYHYCIFSGETNLRSGMIMIVNNSVTCNISESSTNDIGNTSDVTFTSSVNGANVELYINSLSNGWVCEWVKITK